MEKKRVDRGTLKALTLITQFGINMIVPIVMLTLLGVWLDRKFETGFITIILFFFGAFAGAQNVYRMSKGLDSSDKDGKRSKKNDK